MGRVKNVQDNLVRNEDMLKIHKINDRQTEIILRKLKNTTSFGHDVLTTKVLSYFPKPFSTIVLYT